MASPLRKYQNDGIAAIHAAFLNQSRRVLYVAPTGSGKTRMFSAMTRLAAAKGKTVAIMVHRRELVDQIALALRDEGVRFGLIVAGEPMNQAPLVQVASVLTLAKRLDTVHQPDLLIVDECFPPGTLIDGVPIEEIAVGDTVRSFNHATRTIETKRVLKTFRREARALVRVTTENGSVICTPEHPFWNGMEYIPAKCLTPYCMAFKMVGHEPKLESRSPLQKLRGSSGSGELLPPEKAQDWNRPSLLSRMRQGVDEENPQLLQRIKNHSSVHQLRRSGGSGESISSEQAEDWKGASLLAEMRQGVERQTLQRHYDENQREVQRALRRTDQEPCCVGCDKGESVGGAQGDWAQASRSRREWSPPHDSRASTGDGVGLAYLLRGSNGNAEGQRIPHLLQDRRGPAGTQDRFGSGRFQPLRQIKTASRSKEGRFLTGVRVVSVEILERGSDDFAGCLRGSSHVFNLEVEGNNNYFADGFLVHNCAHAVSDSYKSIMAKWPKVFVLGVTATPERLDGKGLGDVFGALVRGPEVADLIEQGYLARPIYFAPPSADLSGVGTVAGDYNKGQLAERFDKPKITGDAVDHYRRICPGVPAIAFCVSLIHAENVAASFRAAGYHSQSIDGTMTKEQRRQRLRDLTSGAIHVLTSCELISEGLDIPRVIAGILLRPTQSLSLHLQQLGRELRPCPGKLHAIILDHADNLRRHGLAEQRREWSLEGFTEKKERAAKQEENIELSRQCPTCYRVHAPAPACPQCGHVYEGRKIRQVAGVLVPLNATQSAREGAYAKCPECGTIHLATLRNCPNPKCHRDHSAENARETAQARNLQELIMLGKTRGYKNPSWWGKKILEARHIASMDAADKNAEFLARRKFAAAH